MYDICSNYGLTSKRLFEKLEFLYENNGYYEHYKYPGNDTVRSLMNPTNRSVEFFVSHVAKEITVNTQNENIKNAIDQILTWSNFDGNKPVFLRKLSLLGNLILKIVTDGSKVWFEMVDLKTVQNIKVNGKGYIQEITICVPMNNYTYVEYWNKEYMATWKTQRGENFTIDELGTPETKIELPQLGIDFVPFVHIKMKDVGETWGDGAVNHALDKIDSVNVQMTKLQDLLSIFNTALTVIRANQVDSNGLPVPPPMIPETSRKSLYTDSRGSIVSLPGSSDLNTIVPDIKYAEALQIMNRQMEEIEEDLPELKANKLSDNASGKALKLQLGSAISRAEEEERNFIQGLKRVLEISLTIGSYHAIFSGIGTYEFNYDFEFDTPAMFPVGMDEKAELLKNFMIAGLPLASALRLVGFDEEFIAIAVQEKQKESISPMDNLLAQQLGG